MYKKVGYLIVLVLASLLVLGCQNPSDGTASDETDSGATASAANVELGYLALGSVYKDTDGVDVWCYTVQDKLDTKTEFEELISDGIFWNKQTLCLDAYTDDPKASFKLDKGSLNHTFPVQDKEGRSYHTWKIKPKKGTTETTIILTVTGSNKKTTKDYTINFTHPEVTE